MACPIWLKAAGVVAFNVPWRFVKVFMHLVWLLIDAVLHPLLKMALVLVWPRGAIRWPFWKLVFCTMWLNKIKAQAITENTAQVPPVPAKSVEAAVKAAEDLVDKAGQQPVSAAGQPSLVVSHP
jgi:hypothetical protein